jgi:small subunit ribosomal protein S19e
MVLVRDANAQELINRAAEKLEKVEELRPPEWARFVKTGVHKERPPTQKNWWWIRSASILRKLYVGESIGVSRLRKVYGGRKNRGHKPEHKLKASGAVIRNILQQLEKAGLIESKKGKGRTISAKGKAFMNSAAKGIKQ